MHSWKDGWQVGTDPFWQVAAQYVENTILPVLLQAKEAKVSKVEYQLPFMEIELMDQVVQRLVQYKFQVMLETVKNQPPKLLLKLPTLKESECTPQN